MAMKVTARKLLPVLNLAAAVIAMCVLLKPLGGWRGNVDCETLIGMASSYDTAPNGESVLFNRWLILFPTCRSDESEWEAFKPIIYWRIANLPAMLLSNFLMEEVLLTLWIWLGDGPTNFMLGLSSMSYNFILLMICGVVQWFLIGTLIDKWMERRRKRKEEI